MSLTLTAAPPAPVSPAAPTLAAREDLGALVTRLHQFSDRVRLALQPRRRLLPGGQVGADDQRRQHPARPRVSVRRRRGLCPVREARAATMLLTAA